MSCVTLHALITKLTLCHQLPSMTIEDVNQQDHIISMPLCCESTVEGYSHAARWSADGCDGAECAGRVEVRVRESLRAWSNTRSLHTLLAVISHCLRLVRSTANAAVARLSSKYSCVTFTDGRQGRH